MLNPRRLMPDGVTNPTGTAENLTVSTGVSNLTVPAGSHYAEITCNTNSIRLRLDGTDPTAAIGHLVSAGENFVIAGGELGGCGMIRAGGSDANVYVQYYRA